MSYNSKRHVILKQLQGTIELVDTVEWAKTALGQPSEWEVFNLESSDVGLTPREQSRSQWIHQHTPGLSLYTRTPVPVIPILVSHQRSGRSSVIVYYMAWDKQQETQ